MPLHRMVLQVETVDHRRRLRGMHVDVNRLLQSIKGSRFEQGFESSVRSHGLPMGLSNCHILVRSSNPKMPAGGGVPPENEGILIIRAQVDVDIKRKAVSKVVVVKSDGSAAQEVLHGHPHELKRPHGIETQRLRKSLVLGDRSMSIVSRRVTNGSASNDRVVHFNQNVWIFCVNHAGQAGQTLHVLLPSRRYVVAVLRVPALAVLHGAVKHEIRSAITRQRLKPLRCLIDVLLRGPAKCGRFKASFL